MKGIPDELDRALSSNDYGSYVSQKDTRYYHIRPHPWSYPPAPASRAAATAYSAAKVRRGVYRVFLDLPAKPRRCRVNRPTRVNCPHWRSVISKPFVLINDQTTTKYDNCTGVQ
ncbi:hypothetical protein J6590_059186 [Homalodisca vitripennis]|nr:hypothetical protein J6590_059186 [Homalodisca vitripennis]